MAHDDDEYDDLPSAAGVDRSPSPELDLTLATPAYLAPFEADFSVFDRDQNFSGTYDAVESGNSIHETTTKDDDIDDTDWCDPRCPSRNYFTPPDIITMRSRNSELGSIVLSITKAGFEIELGSNRNYRAWEDVLLMDPQESVARCWSV